jgi:formiminoglutamase
MSTALEYYHQKDLLARTNVREGEERLGQNIATIGSALFESADPIPFKFTLLGIEEDFGVRANHGRGGADGAFQAFLSHFCNLQDNRFIPSDQIAVLGAIVATEKHEDSDINALRTATQENDLLVRKTIERIVLGGSIPIVIGGGHNNSYGCISGTAAAVGHSISCLNIDAHTDLRALEGRHSGNGFSYAKAEGSLGAYFMWGLQENYTPEYIWQFMEDHDDVEYLSYEDYLAGEEHFEDTLVRMGELLGDRYGIELDVDVIAEFPSSAQSISGFSLEYVRKLMYALDTLPHYFHLCEGRISSAEDSLRAGRGLALLVADFIKAHIYSE